MKLVLEDLDHEVVLLFPESGTSVGNCATVLNFTRRWSQIWTWSTAVSTETASDVPIGQIHRNFLLTFANLEFVYLIVTTALCSIHDKTRQRKLGFASNNPQWCIGNIAFRLKSFFSLTWQLWARRKHQWLSKLYTFKGASLILRFICFVFDIKWRKDRLLKVYELVLDYFGILILFYLRSIVDLNRFSTVLYLHFVEESHSLFGFISQFHADHLRTKYHHRIFSWSAAFI